jgi:hypothetical protein
VDGAVEQDERNGAVDEKGHNRQGDHRNEKAGSAGLPRAVASLSHHVRRVPSAMGLFGKLRGKVSGDPRRTDGPSMGVDRKAVRDHLHSFATTRRGVEAYVEPATNVTAESIVLVATDGEWTRRAVGSRKAAFELAKSLDLPVYDVLLTGYPKRMREWSSRQRRGQG